MGTGRGFFVTLEGPEGSGKSLQSRALAQRLEASGYRVLQTREPGGTPLGDRLRALLLDHADLEVTDRAEALMMCAARAQHVAARVAPALAAGQVVVCDRYGDSTLAYQGHGRGLDVAQLRAVLSFATAGLAPDLTILLDVPVDAGLARKRGQGDGGAEWNRFEAEAMAFHQRVRDGYLALMVEEPARWVRLDATQPPELVAAAAWSIVEERLPR